MKLFSLFTFVLILAFPTVAVSKSYVILFEKEHSCSPGVEHWGQIEYLPELPAYHAGLTVRVRAGYSDEASSQKKRGCTATEQTQKILRYRIPVALQALADAGWPIEPDTIKTAALAPGEKVVTSIGFKPGYAVVEIEVLEPPKPEVMVVKTPPPPIPCTQRIETTEGKKADMLGAWIRTYEHCPDKKARLVSETFLPAGQKGESGNPGTPGEAGESESNISIVLLARTGVTSIGTNEWSVPGVLGAGLHFSGDWLYVDLAAAYAASEQEHHRHGVEVLGGAGMRMSRAFDLGAELLLAQRGEEVSGGWERRELSVGALLRTCAWRWRHDELCLGVSGHPLGFWLAAPYAVADEAYEGGYRVVQPKMRLFGRVLIEITYRLGIN